MRKRTNRHARFFEQVRDALEKMDTVRSALYESAERFDTWFQLFKEGYDQTDLSKELERWTPVECPIYEVVLRELMHHAEVVGSMIELAERCKTVAETAHKLKTGGKSNANDNA